MESLQPQFSRAASNTAKAPLVTPDATLKRMLSGDCKRLNVVPELKMDPWHWGILVSKVLDLQAHVKDDMDGYCKSHCVGPQFRHLCLCEPCPWDHANAPHVEAEAYAEAYAATRSPMIGNMHLLVQRYVRPWTAPYSCSYSALVVAEEAVQKLHSKTSLGRTCAAEVFISHCWNEPFADFTKTLAACLDPLSVVWVCSLGIDQNANIADEIGGNLLDCPFAKGLLGAKRVLVVMDAQAEPLERVWCVLEAHLAFLFDKPFDFALPDDTEEAAWRHVDEKLSKIDVRECHATNPSDRTRILQFVEESGQGCDTLNSHVRRVSARAAEQASVFAAAAAGRMPILMETELELLGRRNSRERVPLHFAAERNRVEALLLINERTSGEFLEARDCDGRTPLSVAAETGAIGAIHALLGLGADMWSSSADDTEKRSSTAGSMPMHIAAMHGHTAVVAALHEVDGGCLDARNARGYTPLHLASSRIHVEATALLVSLSADPNIGDRHGMRPLHDVDSKKGDAAIEILRMLIDRRAELDARSTDGRTAVFVGTQVGRNRALAVLLDARADGSLSTAKGYSPLHVAAEKGNVKCIEVLVGASADVDQLTVAGSAPVKVAVMYNRRMTLRRLLDLSADPDARGLGSASALNLAVKRGLIEHAKLLLECGASATCDARGDGRGAWYTAAIAQQGPCLRLLVERAAGSAAGFADKSGLVGKSGLFLDSLSEFLTAVVPSWDADGGPAEIYAAVGEVLLRTCAREVLASEDEQRALLDVAEAGASPDDLLLLGRACLEVLGDRRAAAVLRRVVAYKAWPRTAPDSPVGLGRAGSAAESVIADGGGDSMEQGPVSRACATRRGDVALDGDAVAWPVEHPKL